MWIMADTGFISLVKYRSKDGADEILVRSRVKADIESMFPNTPIETLPGADYLYRAVVERKLVATVIAEKILTLDYDSHAKDVAIARSAPAQGRSAAYYASWSAMAKMQPYAPYSKISREEQARHRPVTSNYAAWSGPARLARLDQNDVGGLEFEDPREDVGVDIFGWDDDDLLSMSENERRMREDLAPAGPRPAKRRGRRGGRKHNRTDKKQAQA